MMLTRSNLNRYARDVVRELERVAGILGSDRVISASECTHMARGDWPVVELRVTVADAKRSVLAVRERLDPRDNHDGAAVERVARHMMLKLVGLWVESR